MNSKVHQIYHRLITQRSAALCQFQDEEGNRCDKSAISSHTVQRSRALGSIAEDGHVLHIRLDSFSSDDADRIKFDKIGVRKASVFPGFCSAHDHSLFESIETGTGVISERERVLLSFRSICHELFKKERVIWAYSDQDFRRAVADLGYIKYIDGHLEGCKLAQTDLLRSKVSHLNFLHKNVGRFRSALFRMDSGLPFAFSTAFAPEYDLLGNDLLPPENREWGSLSCFSGHIKGNTVLVFSGFDDVKHHPISTFIDSLSNLEANRAGGYALHTALEFSENCYFKPSWVSKLIPEVKAELIRRYKSGTPGAKSKTKKDLAHQFDVVRVKGELQKE
jgi:hypothetical protein